MSDDVDDDAARRESDELRALWSALPAPRAGVDADGLPSEDAEASDHLTRAAIEHLRAAWAAHAVEVPEVPFGLRRAHGQRLALRAEMPMQRSTRTLEPSRRASSGPRLRILALAATAAAAVLVLALRHDRTSHDVERTREGLLVASGVDTPAGPSAEEPRELTPSPLPSESVATLVDIPREDFKLRADGFEFESQGVRFVLIETTGEAPSSAPDQRK